MAYVSTENRSESYVVWSPEMDLSADITHPLINVGDLPPGWGSDQSNRVLILEEIIVMYLVTPSVDESNNLRIGSSANSSAYYDISTLMSKTAGTVDVFDQSSISNPRVFSGDNWMQVALIGTSGTGMIKVGLRVTSDISKWIGYDTTP